MRSRHFRCKKIKATLRLSQRNHAMENQVSPLVKLQPTSSFGVLYSMESGQITCCLPEEIQVGKRCSILDNTKIDEMEGDKFTKAEHNTLIALTKVKTVQGSCSQYFDSNQIVRSL